MVFAPRAPVSVIESPFPFPHCTETNFFQGGTPETSKIGWLTVYFPADCSGLLANKITSKEAAFLCSLLAGWTKFADFWKDFTKTKIAMKAA